MFPVLEKTLYGSSIETIQTREFVYDHQVRARSKIAISFYYTAFEKRRENLKTREIRGRL